MTVSSRNEKTWKRDSQFTNWLFKLFNNLIKKKNYCNVEIEIAEFQTRINWLLINMN